ncbi:Glycerol-3-phosphate ABC transporter, permease protein UgpA [Caenispirillum salinarum AK4]|uniref:Glycerol-3-phosphate ABC transporter, permease protein UgpA n=1 Tax=Caenispirillum salinarum AK4 TaxID=1238182 RepID=K9HVN0_9PROT|nr:Glycerol-3-phosphate ABC transporter, permease protein UgpA [Caenispirillum salinarum AK4]
MQRRGFLAGSAATLAALGLLPAEAWGQGAPMGTPEVSTAARRWAEVEFRPSTLSLEERLAEMAFFQRAARPFRGMRLYVLSETIGTHVYEARVLARAFAEITGITVVHDLVQEGEVVNRIQQQRRTGRNFYDAYVNDSDFIGTHYRFGGVVPVSDWMAGEGAEVTLPTLDVADFFGRGFCTAPDGKLYQLPDQQFANLYWFRHDWFQREDLQEAFRARYGYELGVPVNWRAYEDIAEFFTNTVRQIDGRRVWGHMDYGARDPSLGWRFTDAWLPIAGAGDTGLPNGHPVADWGIRVEDCVPVGSAVARGGAANSPAAVYALRKYLEWLEAYAPPEAAGMTFSQAGPVPARGDIAQQVFWYSAFMPDMVRPGSAVMNPDGTARWRMAPTPHGAYWRPGMKQGYQDCGAWTLMESTPVPRRKAAWLYAQFCVCKSVSLKKTMVGLTPIRDSDMRSASMAEAAPRLGGLVEFYRSPARLQWTPTGPNVPHYPLLAQLWWQVISAARAGRATPQEALDGLAAAQDDILARLGQAPGIERCAPALAEAEDPAVWLSRPGAPKPGLADEEGRGETVPYADILRQWQEQG